jgi:hypothetical protein
LIATISNCNGFDKGFVPDLVIDLAAIIEPVKKTIATLAEPTAGRARRADL